MYVCVGCTTVSYLVAHAGFVDQWGLWFTYCSTEPSLPHKEGRMMYSYIIEKYKLIVMRNYITALVRDRENLRL